MKTRYAELLSNITNTPSNAQDSILILDGLNTFLRSFTMINHTNSDGHHVGALTGFLKSLGYAIKLLDPTKVIIVFDGVGGSNSKKNLYPEYKANRNKSRMTNFSIFLSKEEEAESINNQMGRLIQYLQCLPITLICIDGIEADDVIGYLAVKFENFALTHKVTIMSADKDFLQLTSEKTQVYSPTKKKIYTPKDVIDEYEVHNLNFINYKILMGDQSDNLPGVPGLGPKKLLKLFPILSENRKISLNEVLIYASERVNEHALYSSVIERRHQLEINKQLMDLQTIPLSDGNKIEIQQNFNNAYSLNKNMFMQMYLVDKLNEGIPNTSNWLSQVFGGLDNF
jgi:5'-3' exonuclease